jgi:hypothetical protein
MELAWSREKREQEKNGEGKNKLGRKERGHHTLPLAPSHSHYSARV